MTRSIAALIAAGGLRAMVGRGIDGTDYFDADTGELGLYGFMEGQTPTRAATGEQQHT